MFSVDICTNKKRFMSNINNLLNVQEKPYNIGYFVIQVKGTPIPRIEIQNKMAQSVPSICAIMFRFSNELQ